MGIGPSCALAFHPDHVSLDKQYFRLVIVVADEIAEGQFLPGLAGEGLKPVGDLNSQPAKVLPDVLQNVLPGKAVKLNGAAGREMGEIKLHFFVDGKRCRGRSALSLVSTR